MATIEKTVFISYRRKDISWALAVYYYLTKRDYDVFFDFTSIPSGDFEHSILSNIKARAHFLVILTPSALDRCSESEDWLRREIETAMIEKRNIVPLFFDSFSFGAPSVSKNLTGELARLKKYNGIDVPVGYFDEAMERLCNRYLNVVLDSVIHPISDEVQKMVNKQKIAANEAITRQGVPLENDFEKQKEGNHNVDVDEIFTSLFGINYPVSFKLKTKGTDISFNLSISSEEADLGAVKEIDFQREELCSTCNGLGAESENAMKICTTCGGTGEIRAAEQSVLGPMVRVSKCSTCNGSGQQIITPCRNCLGKGTILCKHRAKIRIPQNTIAGTKIKFSGIGNIGRNGGERGDVYVIVSVVSKYI